jgi:hypothetical protein
VEPRPHRDFSLVIRGARPHLAELAIRFSEIPMTDGFPVLLRRHPAASMTLPLLAALAIAGCTPLPPELGMPEGTLSDRWEVRFDPQLGTPVQMTNRALEDDAGTRQRAVSDTAAAAAVLAVFEENPLWFHLRRGVDGFRVIRNTQSGWLREVQVEQTYRGLPVAGAGYKVRVLPSGRVATLQGSFHPEIVIESSPVLEGTQAEDRARNAYPPGTTPRLRPLLIEDYGIRPESRILLVLPLEGSYRLAWAVRIRTDAGFTRVYVDARNGELLGAQYLGTYER